MVTIELAPRAFEPLPKPADELAITPRPTRRTHGRWLLAVLAVVIGLTLASPAGRHQWALSFIRQPTPSTTLSFRDSAALPHTVEIGARVRLSLTVANHEGRRLAYPLVVSSANLGDTHAMTVLHRSTLTVPSSGQRTTSIAVRPACTASTCELQVSLPGHHETIDVLLDMRRHLT
jgi:hypothetical protein